MSKSEFSEFSSDTARSGALIECKNVHKIYKSSQNIAVHALKGLDLRVDQGEFLAIQGVSGSGKSTLLNILGFLDVPTEGKYIFRDQDTYAFQDRKTSRLRNNEIGFILQDFALLEDESALYNVCLPLLMTKEKRNSIKRKAENILQSVGLEHKQLSLVKNLSGGEKQRVAIARALVIKPSILLADEPTGALDSETGNEIMALLKSLNEKGGVTIIAVTHNDQVASYANRRLVMRDGMFA